jgi:hypothetical protein
MYHKVAAHVHVQLEDEVRAKEKTTTETRDPHAVSLPALPLRASSPPPTRLPDLHRPYTPAAPLQ